MRDNSSHPETTDGTGVATLNNSNRPDYEELERKAWRDNLQKIPMQFAGRDSNIVKKIKTFTERFGFDEKDVHERIEGDELFRAHFVTDPKKQNIYEKIASEWIKGIQGVRDFEHLPTSGRSAVYLGSNGEFVKGPQIKGTDRKKGKSLDFKWQTGNWTVYASHKYTKQTGGSQDNQFNDIRGLIDRFALSTAEDAALIVIADGDYYSKERMKNLNHNRRRDIPLSFAIHIEELPSVLAGILEKQGLARPKGYRA